MSRKYLLSTVALFLVLVFILIKSDRREFNHEGVIVGRSLDMFISKLRKKLEVDPAVKLVNVHGKGYKLEISPDYSPVNLL